MLASLSPILAVGDEEIAVVFFIVAGVVAITGIVMYHRHKSRVAGFNARLKQMMIERGMSADEIERVVRATPGGGEQERAGCRPRRPMEV